MANSSSAYGTDTMYALLGQGIEKISKMPGAIGTVLVEISVNEFLAGETNAAAYKPAK